MIPRSPAAKPEVPRGRQVTVTGERQSRSPEGPGAAVQRQRPLTGTARVASSGAVEGLGEAARQRGKTGHSTSHARREPSEGACDRLLRQPSGWLHGPLTRQPPGWLHSLDLSHQTLAGRPETRLRGSAELSGLPLSGVGLTTRQRRGAEGGHVPAVAVAESARRA